MAAEDDLQLPGHRGEVEKSVDRPGLEVHDHVDVAGRPEVILEDGPEEGELPYLPFLTECRDLSPWQGDMHFFHGYFPGILQIILS